MDPILKNIVFYIVIAGDDKTDHVFLRKAVNKIVPQAIVESLYEGTETMTYFEKHNTTPNLIFLDSNMLSIQGKKMMNMIRGNDGLKQVPVIILTDKKDHFTKKDLLAFGADEFYSKPYHVKALDHIVNEVREKWFTSMLNQKHIS